MSELVPADRARLREIGREIHTLRGEGARVLYRLGLLLREVESGELWRSGGFGGFGEWLEEEADIGRSTAYRAMAVVRHFNEEIAARYGFDKLYLGLRYMELTRRAEQPGDLIAADLRLRDARGRFITVPFHEASVRQIQDAIAVQSARRSARPSLDEGLGDRLDRLEAALPAPVAGMRKAKRRVEVLRSRGGEVSLSFRQIPLEQLDAFLQAVRAELLGE